MARRSRFVQDLIDAADAFDRVNEGADEFRRNLEGINRTPVAPAGRGGGGTAGRDLRNVSDAATVGGAPGGGVTVGAGGNARSSVGAGGGSGGRTAPASAALDFDALLAVYVADPNSQASQPVKRIMDTLLFVVRLSWDDAIPKARAAFEALSGNRASGSAGGGGGNPAGARDLRANPNVGGGGYVDVPTYLSNTTGKATADGSRMTAGEGAIVAEIRKLNKNLSDGGNLRLRSAGMV